VFFVADYPADAPAPILGDDFYTGTVTDAGVEWVNQNCVGAFARYVGVPREQSRYALGFAFPPPNLRGAGIGRSLCWVANPDSSPLIQSVKGTAK
jgi:hypothetical protein